MPDVFSKKKRSEIMRKVKSKNTKPEILIRRELHKRGYRYRLHDSKLPGKPDIVLPKYKTIIQVRGCFWHGHDCKAAKLPKSNREYWSKKQEKNQNRDKKNDQLLKGIGWKVIVIWECSINTKENFEKEIESVVNQFLFS